MGHGHTVTDAYRPGHELPTSSCRRRRPILLRFLLLDQEVTTAYLGSSFGRRTGKN